MSDAEKAAMRSHLHRFMARNPLGAAPVPSPFSLGVTMMRFRYALAGLLVFVSVGATTVSAASRALPGDVLYPVKLNVNEAIEETLAFSNEAKAAFHAQVASLRLEEAETLIARGGLTAQAKDTIEQNFAAHANEAKKLSQDLKESNPGAAQEVETQFSSSLSAHDAVLGQLSAESDDATTKKESSDLALFVRSHQEESAKVAVEVPVRAALFASSASPAGVSTTPEERATTTSAQNLDVALRLQDTAQTALEGARDDFAGVQTKFSTSTVAKITGEFSALDATMKEGADALAQGDTESAAQSFTEVLQVAIKLQIFFDAQQKFKKDFISPLFNVHQPDFHGEVRGTTTNNGGDNKENSDQQGGSQEKHENQEGGLTPPEVDINL